MKKIIAIILAMLMFLSIFISFVNAGEIKTIKVVYIGTKTCLSCIETMTEINKILKELKNENINIDYKMYDTSVKENFNLLLQYDEVYNMPDNLIGVGDKIFIGGKYLYNDDIILKLKETIKYYNDYPEQYNDKYSDSVKTIKTNNSLKTLDSFAPIGVFIAGFIDGFNPCSIAMMLFFISFLIISKRKNREILITGTVYVVGTFIAYFLIGTGIMKIAYIFNDTKWVFVGIISLTIIMSVYLSVIYLKDYISIKKGNVQDIKTQLSMNNKHLIHNFIRSRNLTKYLYITSFVSGFIISFLEFFCTGQIYLPTISYILSTKVSMYKSLSYLLIYNLAFILPLILATIAIYKGKEVIDISQTLISNMKLIKIVGSVFFGIIAMVMIIKLFNII